MEQKTLASIYFATFAALALGMVLFYESANIEMKLRWHRRLTIGGGALLLVIGLVLAPHVVAFAGPMIAVVMIVNLTMTKFCRKCGLTLYARLEEKNFCRRCGADLEP